MHAMILAAGRGERLRPLTDHSPKPLIKAAGKPLIEYHLENLAAAGVTRVVINHAWLGHMLEQHLGDGRRWGVEIVYSPETAALETGGGIKQALPLLTDNGRNPAPFLVVNGDVFVDQLPQVEHWTLPDGMLAKLFLVDNPEQHPQGDFALDGQLLTLQPEFDHKRLTFSGIGVYHPEFFNDSPTGAFGTPLLIRREIARGRVCGSHFEGYWCDVGTVTRLQGLEQRLIQTCHRAR